MTGSGGQRGQAPGWDAEDLPLLGEPFAVELANTDYRTPEAHYDLLAAAADARLWFEHAVSAQSLHPPRSLSRGRLAALREVRDATRRLLTLAAAGRAFPGDRSAVEILNRHAAPARAHVVLGLAGTEPTWWIEHSGPAGEAFVPAVASRCILFLGGEDVARVRRCERPACPLLFVQRHRRRRFCSESCTHRLRQARYSLAVTRAPSPP